MANYNNLISYSNFKEMPDSKYYDFFDVANAYKKGHATYETFNWYFDFASGFDEYSPWLGRGGSSKVPQNAGIFFYIATIGNSTGPIETDSPHAFRVVLSHS